MIMGGLVAAENPSADFSHDNDMTSMLGALGLYGATALPPLPNDTYVPPERAGGYSASWTVPFAARVYVEKMSCATVRERKAEGGGEDGGGGEDKGKGGGEQEGEEEKEEELVRILVNDRVVPLVGCGADARGRCSLSRFIDSLAFAREGGEWDRCFI